MERVAWRGRIKAGCEEIYKKRHDEIWPEMIEVLKQAGVCNYSIFLFGNEVFGYYECEKGIETAQKVQKESVVVAHWDEYMRDILEIELDPYTGEPPQSNQVFRMD